MARGLSSRAPLQDLGFHRFGSQAWTWHCLSGHAEVASHIAQPEALTTRIYNYVLGGFGEKKKEKKRRRFAKWIQNQDPTNTGVHKKLTSKIMTQVC